MTADKNDEPGVLGNLPRSRPGHRSDKRGGRAAGAATAKNPKPRTARKAPTASATATARAARPAPRPQVERETHRGADPLSAAVNLVGKVAEAGLKTAADLLRRLPGR